MQTTKQVGKLIFYKRIEKGLKQDELCQGICSVSYLSKIENDKISASEEILQLLCNRLGIKLSDVQNIEQEIKQTLDEWHAVLVHMEKEKAEALYLRLKERIQRVTDFEIINYYNLLYLRYLLMIRDLDKASIVAQDLKKVSHKYSAFQAMLYIYLTGLISCMQGEWGLGTKRLVEAEKRAKQVNYFEAGMYYNLALSQSQVENIPMALYFADIAIEGFRNECKFRNIIDCQVIMAINYARMGEYDKALRYYENIMRVAHSFADKERILAMVLHNMGYLYSKKKQYEQAIELYLESLKYKAEGSDSYIRTVYEMVMQYINLKRIKEAEAWLKKGIALAEQNNVEKKTLYSLLVLYYKHYKKPLEYKELLEQKAIPFFKQTEQWSDLRKLYIELAEYFENILEYKESIRCYKLAVGILEKERGR
ncbi:MAG: tetratricopeptide repeat protein [Ectobacillus sp.]